VFLNDAMSAALDRIAERAADARRAFTPGALPQNDDVSTAGPVSDFTLDPLAVSAPEGTYFITSDGRGGFNYTRDGSFALRGGSLVDRDGRNVCGVRGPGEAPAELRVDAVDESLGRIGRAAVEHDGSLTYRRETIDPRTGRRESQRIVAGRIALARFPAATRLTSGEGDELRTQPGVPPHVGLPGEAGLGVLAPMQRDRSRVDIDRSLIRLKEAYLAFDALQAAEAARMHVGKAALDLVK
jgi:flagellar basal body rod protein FlgG